MTSKLKIGYVELNSDTIESVRKEHNLHKPGVLDQAIDVLSDWIVKQDHLIKKDLPRNYLERFIISAKGSVEIAKKRIDKLYTLQTMVPNLFEKTNAKKDFPNLRNFFVNVVMPNLSDDNCRIHIGRLMSKDITAAACLNSYQHCRVLLEYGKLHDYAKGYHIVYDLSEANIMELISNVDWVDLKNALTMLIEGYGYKLMSIYIISPSKMISSLITILKQLVSEKIGNRIYSLKSVEALDGLLPKQMLPKEFGGAQKSILDLYDEQNEHLASEQHLAHMEAMRRARSDENLRSSDSFDKEYLGMPGSFRMLNVD